MAELTVSEKIAYLWEEAKKIEGRSLSLDQERWWKLMQGIILRQQAPDKQKENVGSEGDEMPADA